MLHFYLTVLALRVSFCGFEKYPTKWLKILKNKKILVFPLSGLVCLSFNHIALRMVKILWSFGRSECNRVKVCG